MNDAQTPVEVSKLREIILLFLTVCPHHFTTVARLVLGW